MEIKYTLDLVRLREVAKTNLAGLVSLFGLSGDFELGQTENHIIPAQSLQGVDLQMLFSPQNIVAVCCVGGGSNFWEFDPGTSQFQRCIELGIYQVAR